MRKLLLFAVGAFALIAPAAIGETAEDDHAAYVLRDNTMRQLGRNIYVRIGRVVQGHAPYGPDTITAAESAERLTATLPTLFPPGSDVPPSRMRTELLALDSGQDTLIAAVQAATGNLVTAARGGDKTEMANAFKAVNDACTACHTKYRNDN